MEEMNTAIDIRRNKLISSESASAKTFFQAGRRLALIELIEKKKMPKHVKCVGFHKGGCAA